MEFKPGEIYWQMPDKQKYIRGKWGEKHATAVCF